MSFGINVTCEGRLAKDPETKVAGDMYLTTFRMAVDEKKRKGQEKGDTTWVGVDCWGDVSEQANVFTKGDLVQVTGSLRVRDYQARDGAPRYSIDIRAESVQAVFPRSGNGRTERYEI